MRVEGFDAQEGGKLPPVAQSSSIPSSTPGATTSDPTAPLAQSKDIQALLEVMTNFENLAKAVDPKSTNMTCENKSKAEFLRGALSSLRGGLAPALANPGTSSITLTEVNALRKSFEEIISALRGATVSEAAIASAKDSAYIKQLEAELKPTVVAGVPGIITIQELEDLAIRIKEEHTRISALRSTSPTLVARQEQLEKLEADVREFISKVKRGNMKLSDVPIKSSDAQAFLAQLRNTNKLPDLIAPAGTTNSYIKANPMIAPYEGANGAGGGIGGGANAIQSLLENAKHIKWNLQLKVEYDPKFAARERVLSRLEQMETRFTNLMISETPMPKEMYETYKTELQTLQALLISSSHDDDHKTFGKLPIKSTRMDDQANAEDPSNSQVYAAQGTGFGVKNGTLPNGEAAHDNGFGANSEAVPSKSGFPNGEDSPDTAVRPGFPMNDDTIARRASASAFDPSTVGGLDYKQRALELCRQAQVAQLGDSASLGCIKNPSEVSADYSWKGNYAMVCNRIGDTWGGWYPEMFGCPKYDPTSKFKGTML
jgi:hypothetical protein